MSKKKIRTITRQKKSSNLDPLLPWQVLVVDDEPDIHAVTSLALAKLSYEGRGVQLLHAYSGVDARRLLADGANNSVAVALVDVVMESDDAGLQLVHYIRHELGNRLMRVVIRTGQPGYAPERQVVEQYDIDDYKEKTELTTQKVYSTIRLALKAYSDLMVIQRHKEGVEYILNGAPKLYGMGSVEDLFWGVLHQVVGLFYVANQTGVAGAVEQGPLDAMLITLDEAKNVLLPTVCCATGGFKDQVSLTDELIEQCREVVRDGLPGQLGAGGYSVPLMIKNKLIGLIYLANTLPMPAGKQELLKILTCQISAALENHWLARQLLHTERLATLGTFSAGVAHEIRNPNSFISGNVAFLQQFWQVALPILKLAVVDQPKSQVARFLQEIDPALDGIAKGSQRIAVIIDSLKAYATGNRGTEKRVTRLQDPINEARTLLQHRFKHGTELIVSVPEGLNIVCNAQEISQVFINLFNNAMDAMDEQDQKQNRTIWVTVEQQATTCRVLVKDSGRGIPKSLREDIFNPFITTKGAAKGTGLGLSIVKGIVETHQGRIAILDHDPPGVTFELIFPLAA